jgi:Tfp pilus assembly protein PilX
MNRIFTKQHGVAMFTALIFLVIVTLLSITAMRTSTMELQMASNEQENRIGTDSAQSAIEVVVDSNRIKIDGDGSITCFGFGETPPDTTPNGKACDTKETVTSAASHGTDNKVAVTMLGSGSCPPSIAISARGSSSMRRSGSSSTGTCAYFSIESFYDATAKRGGRTETQEGFVRIAF